MTSISERELIIPALFLLDDSDGGLTTSELQQKLREMLHPTGDDLTILSGRSDDKFSQKVRNLSSHDTLTSPGLATKEPGRNGPFRITEEGRAHYLQHSDTLTTLADFSLEDSAEGLQELAQGNHIEVLDDLVVREGELRTRTIEYRTRSAQLRNAAIEKYRSKNGRLRCRACRFDFARAYPGIGDGFIHIHHLKPVSFMSGEPMNLNEALKNVRPLCANCHQMVHTSRPPLLIRDLRTIMAFSYTYK